MGDRSNHRLHRMCVPGMTASYPEHGCEGCRNAREESVYQNTFPGYPDVVDVEDLCGMLGISSVTAYKLLKGGKIGHLRIGRKYKIPKIQVLRYLGLVA